MMTMIVNSRRIGWVSVYLFDWRNFFSSARSQIAASVGCEIYFRKTFVSVHCNKAWLYAIAWLGSKRPTY